jgi:hypothetical protein
VGVFVDGNRCFVIDQSDLEEPGETIPVDDLRLFQSKASAVYKRIQK